MTSLVEVWFAWLEFNWLFEVLGDVLNQYFGATTCQKIFLVRIELKRLDRHTLMNLRSRDAPLAHLLLCIIL